MQNLPITYLPVRDFKEKQSWITYLEELFDSLKELNCDPSSNLIFKSNATDIEVITDVTGTFLATLKNDLNDPTRIKHIAKC